jgi:hypothetical protein
MELTTSIVIASKAKQPNPVYAKGAPSATARLDCFALLAMTAIHAAPVSRNTGGTRRSQSFQ